VGGENFIDFKRVWESVLLDAQQDGKTQYVLAGLLFFQNGKKRAQIVTFQFPKDQ